MTGSGVRIGRAIVTSLKHAEHSVAVADINLARAKAVVDSLNASGGDAIAIHMDVASRESMANGFGQPRTSTSILPME